MHTGLLAPLVSLRSGIMAFALGAAMSATAVDAVPVPLGHRVANYAYETWYEIKPGAVAGFDSYWAEIEKHDAQDPSKPVRLVDGTADGSGRVVTLAVERLAEYGVERRNEATLRAALSDPAFQSLRGAFNDAQRSRRAYLRQYRVDLSVNPTRFQPGAATEVWLITVASSREAEFERWWRRAAAGYGRTMPSLVLVMSRTLVGGGPQFVLRRPLVARDGPLPSPAEAVRQAFGEAAARDYAATQEALRVDWQTMTLRPVTLNP